MMTKQIIIVMGLQDYFSDKELLLGTSTLYVTMFWLIVVFVSLPYFTLTTHSDSPNLLCIDVPNTLHVINKDVHL